MDKTTRERRHEGRKRLSDEGTTGRGDCRWEKGTKRRGVVGREEEEERGTNKHIK